MSHVRISGKLVITVVITVEGLQQTNISKLLAKDTYCLFIFSCYYSLTTLTLCFENFRHENILGSHTVQDHLKLLRQTSKQCPTYVLNNINDYSLTAILLYWLRL